jgi:hypothetical protein
MWRSVVASLVGFVGGGLVGAVAVLPQALLWQAPGVGTALEGQVFFILLFAAGTATLVGTRSAVARTGMSWHVAVPFAACTLLYSGYSLIAFVLAVLFGGPIDSLLPALALRLVAAILLAFGIALLETALLWLIVRFLVARP